ncbi:MAG: nitrile hydratase accessory protein [Candidatus Dormibacteraeota bacterium]|nr:nitrile hydratase accessory protein [Candidatus Dormibacteraeota bacterium]MBO0746325.1 nitrile hydratase accessory protein [Candidatus Dormibacteraeota bacterium]
MSDVDRGIADLNGPAALPRRNGELVFNSPWEGRAFGIAVALEADHRYSWSAFSRRLAEEIAEAGPDADPARYYERWLAALERLVLEGGLVGRDEFEARVRDYRDGVRDDGF